MSSSVNLPRVISGGDIWAEVDGWISRTLAKYGVGFSQISPQLYCKVPPGHATLDLAYGIAAYLS